MYVSLGLADLDTVRDDFTVVSITGWECNQDGDHTASRRITFAGDQRMMHDLIERVREGEDVVAQIEGWQVRRVGITTNRELVKEVGH